MPQTDPRRVSGFETTAFSGDGWANRSARLLVLDMVLWPGALVVSGTLFVAWQVREHPVALTALLVATFVSAAVAVRQWGVMLRAVFLPARRSPRYIPGSGEDSPRLTGRGGTDR
jgi:hypothetical protein